MNVHAAQNEYHTILYHNIQLYRSNTDSFVYRTRFKKIIENI